MNPNVRGADFTRESATYERHRELLEGAHPNRVALLHGDDLAGVYDSLEEAMTEGCRRFGLNQFMVKEIGDPVHFMPYAVFPEDANGPREEN